ncbi:MAG TPA: four helix bundle protein [Candidatus Methylomirabilis sp.]
MARIERFEDIEAWKKARELTKEVYRKASSAIFGKDFGLRDQLQRAAVSTMANIAEGFDGGSNREFIKFLGYAFRSATEVQSHLYVALDQSYITQRDFDSIYDLSVQVKNLVRGFTRYLRSHRRGKPLNSGA